MLKKINFGKFKIITLSVLMLISLLYMQGCTNSKSIYHNENPSEQEKLNVQLIDAAYTGKKNKVEELLNKSADINAKGGYALNGSWSEGTVEFEGTALIAATENLYIDIINLLLDKGADINAGANLITSAINGPREQTLRYTGRDAEYKKNLANLKEVIKLLIDKKVDVNAVHSHPIGGKSQYALEMAAIRGYKEVVELLLNSGADINLAGSAALAGAAGGGHIDIVEILISRGINAKSVGNEALNAAASAGHINIVKLLISQGISVKGDSIAPALEEVVKRGYIDVLQILLHAGVNTNLDPILFWASSVYWDAGDEYIEIVKILIAHGANVNALTEYYSYSSTPLFVAVRHPFTPDKNPGNTRKEIVKMLIEKGADINIKDSNGRTILDDVLESISKVTKDSPPEYKNYLTEVQKILEDAGAKRAGQLK